jgi:hypothetical protein
VSFIVSEKQIVEMQQPRGSIFNIPNVHLTNPGDNPGIHNHLQVCKQVAGAICIHLFAQSGDNAAAEWGLRAPIMVGKVQNTVRGVDIFLSRFAHNNFDVDFMMQM